MEIRLKNIGLIRDSRIILDGLTVITGKNSSGKSTVGKALYSLLDAVSDIRHKAELDHRDYTIKQLGKVQDSLAAFQYPFCYHEDHKGSAFFEDYPVLTALLKPNWRKRITERTVVELGKISHNLYNELSNLDVSSMLQDIGKIFETGFFVSRKDDSGNGSFAELFQFQKNQALNILDKLFEALAQDPELIDYARVRISRTLQMEFTGQIQPVLREPEGPSKIQLFNGNEGYFDLSMSNNAVEKGKHPCYISSPFQRVYFVDDPFVLDDFPRESFIRHGSALDGVDTILNPNRIYSHNEKLSRVLHAPTTISTFEQTLLDDSLKAVKKQIDKVLPGSFSTDTDGLYYVRDGVKLRAVNLATGSKLFSIIKILLGQGKLDNTTMLILDEPEAHLHPQWQNEFAELVILLAKILGVNILLTTHSPNFMLALDAYMRKYNFEEESNFYQTEIRTDGFVDFHCVNDDMGKIYQDFTEYLSDVKMLRDEYYYGDIEEDAEEE